MKQTSYHHKRETSRFENFTFECGGWLDTIEVCYETWGVLNARRDNAVLVNHSLTGTSHAASGAADTSPGWWEFLIGPGKALNPARYYIICASVLGGCSGSTGPSSINPHTGKPYALSFPMITIRDMVRAQKRLIDRLGIRSLVTVTGGSMGGMQALEWAAMHPELVESIIPIAVPGRVCPQSIATRKAGRRAIMNDPDWRAGEYYGVSYPKTGMELARFIGCISYRSEKEFDQRFHRKPADDRYFDLDGRFEVEKYLENQGEKLARWFDPNTYLYLSKAMDLHDLGYGFDTYEAGVRRIRAKTLVIGLSSDQLFPVYQQKELVDILRGTNSRAYYREVDTIHGHDAFLLEKEQVGALIGDFVNGHA